MDEKGKLYYFDGTDYVRMDKPDDIDVPPKFLRKLRWMMAKNHIKAALDLIFRR